MAPTKKKENLAHLSEWMALNTKFFIIRRFNVLNARIILKMQTEICELEDQLSSLDCNTHDKNMARPLSFLHDIELRKDLLDDLEGKLHRYNRYINAYAPIQAREQATTEQIAIMRSWIRTYSAIHPFETNFVLEKDQDLITINELHSTPFRDVLGSMAKSYTAREERKTGIGLRAHIYSQNFFERFERWTVIIGGIVMIVAPLWSLLYIKPAAAQLGLITGFMLLLAVFIWAITNASASELLTAVTAYAAILLVFQSHGG